MQHPTPSPETDRRPVVLLHGFASTPRVMRPLARHLHSQLGRQTVRLPVSSTRDLRAQAVAVMRVIRELAVRAGSPVDVVAHSMGGLIATHALKVLDRERHIGSVVTLGTPHGGSSLARVGALLHRESTPVLGQMLPGAAFLGELAAREVPTHARLVSVVASRDRIVQRASAELETGARQHSLYVADASHSSLLLSRAAFRLVADLLTGHLESAPEALAA